MSTDTSYEQNYCRALFEFIVPFKQNILILTYNVHFNIESKRICLYWNKCIVLIKKPPVNHNRQLKMSMLHLRTSKGSTSLPGIQIGCLNLKMKSRPKR